MRWVFWILAIIGLAIWSLLAWAGYALADAAAAWSIASSFTASTAADQWAHALGVFGKGAILVIWAFGAVAMIAAAIFGFRALDFSRGFVAAFTKRGSEPGDVLKSIKPGVGGVAVRISRRWIGTSLRR